MPQDINSVPGQPELNQLLFQYVYQCVIECGGDGDAVVGFRYQNYKEIANLFEVFLKVKGTWVRIDEDNYIEFLCHQECIIFTSEEKFEETRNYGQRLIVF